LSKHGPTWSAEGVEDDDSALGRARRHGTRDAERRRDAENRMREKEEAAEKMRQLGASSVADAIRIAQDRSESPDRREAAVAVLGGLRYRHAVGPLIEVLSEGQEKLSWMCMWTITTIGSRRHARKLMDIVRGNYPLPARQEAIYTLWRLREVRGEPLFIQVSAALDKEEEYTRDMATEALGNTWRRLSTQRALAARLFDPSVPVRYAALCACSMMSPQPYAFPDFLRRALVAKLADPAKVDDDRAIAELAARLLGRAC
jgi:HEAT repeat protein